MPAGGFLWSQASVAGLWSLSPRSTPLWSLKLAGSVQSWNHANTWLFSRTEDHPHTVMLRLSIVSLWQCVERRCDTKAESDVYECLARIRRIIKHKYNAISASFVTAIHEISMGITSVVQIVANTGWCPGVCGRFILSGGTSGGGGHNVVGAGEHQTSSDGKTLATSRLTATWVAVATFQDARFAHLSQRNNSSSAWIALYAMLRVNSYISAQIDYSQLY